MRKERSAPEGVQYPFEARTVEMGRDADGLLLTSRVIDWNVERMKREKAKKKTLAETTLVEAFAQAHKAKVAVNGTEVEAVSEDDLRDTFKELYLQSKPEAKGFAVNQARRRALKEMEKEITHGTLDGVVYWWWKGNPGGF